MVAVLTRALAFPPASSANRDGLVAVGGDLSVERLLLAYRSGIFPWPIFEDDLMTWFSPDPRAVLELDDFRMSRSLAKRQRKGDFEITINRCFDEVIDACGESVEDRPHTWITHQLSLAYKQLHRAGYAHSVETWMDDQLVGGLYGVAINGLFAGESMFTRASDASKLALVHLVERLKARGYLLLDIQQATPHMMAMGAIEIPRTIYLEQLKHALGASCSFD